MRQTLTILLLLTYSLCWPIEYKIQRLGLENGLSNNYIKSITQDHKGYIWIATESGLNRFDGNQFRIFKRSKTDPYTSISANELNCVYADKWSDSIWIATQRNGLNVFDCRTESFKWFQHSNSQTSISTNDVTSITNSRDGNLWITTYHRGFNYFNKKTGQFTRFNRETLPKLPDNGIWSMTEDSKGILYMGHVNSGFTTYDRKNNILKNYLYSSVSPSSIPSNEITVVFLDKAGYVWLGTPNGLALFNTQSHTFQVFRHEVDKSSSLISNSIMSINQLSDGRMIIGTQKGGISLFNPEKIYLQNNAELDCQNMYSGELENTLSEETIQAIFQDKYDNIWIGTYGGGINFISKTPTLFTVWKYRPIIGNLNSLSNKTAWGTCIDNEGRVWVGTDGGGIDLFEKGQKIKNYNKSNSTLTDNAILAAKKDRDGDLWFGTYMGGVNIFSNSAQSFSHLDIGQTKDIRCFAEDSKGQIWIGTSSGIFVYNKQTKSVINYNKRQKTLPEDLVRSIYHDRNGHVWVGFFGAGLSVYDQNMKCVKIFDTDNSLPSNMITCISEDHKGNVWVGTGEGLVKFSSGDKIEKLALFDERDGISDSHIQALTTDENNNIWFSTFSGIGVYLSKGSIFYSFNHFDGIPNGSFMAGGVTQAGDGRIYFSGQNGICSFMPHSLLQNTEIPAVTITGFKVYNHKVENQSGYIDLPVQSEMHLSYLQNTFNISFNVMNFALQNRVEYRYMLKGLDNKWYNNENGTNITFRNIPPGKYEILISARSRNQNWDDKYTSLEIIIHPPFWLSWWAKVLYGLIIFVIIIFVIIFLQRKINLENMLIIEKRSHQKEQELHAERLSFFTNIAHELRTPLTLILGPLEDLRVDSELDKKQISKITTIHKSVSRLLRLINQILDFRKSEAQDNRLEVRKQSLKELILEIGNKYKDLNANNKIDLKIAIEEGDYEIFFDKEILTVILDNLISNALKYTEQGEIILSLNNSQKGEDLFCRIEVEDTGIGIPESSYAKIFERYYQEATIFQKSGTGIGLAIVKNLAELHHAEIDLSSKVGEGSKFTLLLNKYETYPEAIHLPELEPEQIEENNEEEIVPINSQEVLDSNKSAIRILVVEDDEDINNYIVESLSSDFVVEYTFDGKNALAKVHATKPNLIISDIMMPEMDGFEFTKRLRENEETSQIPIILLSAKDTISDRSKAYALGVESYITKPFSTNMLRNRIFNILKSRKSLIDAIRNTSTTKSDQFLQSLDQLDKEMLDKVVSIIDNHIDSIQLDVKFIADKMHMSHSTLYRKVKSISHLSVNELIRKIRIKKAEELLLSGKYSISDVTFMIGMNSVTYFRNCFKEEFGMAPSEYLKQMKEKRSGSKN
ncbi:MAG: two-component regulator propeller domain-containing protein [Dysgonamonadaceae bacterium]